MFQRVLILSASAGAGHTRAAEAIERAFLLGGEAQEVRHLDSLDYTNALFRNIYSRAYLEMVKTMPEVLGWLYDNQDEPWKYELPKVAFDKLNSGPLIKLLESYQPEITVCTHSLPAEIISWLKAEGRLSTRQAIVITDFDLHALWLCRHYEHYFVAIDETRAHLIELGVPAAKITVSGIPIDPAFSVAKDRRALQQKFGLDPGRATILISAGGFGVGRVDRIVTALLRLQHPSQVVVICGRNHELQAEMERWTARLPVEDRVSFKIVGHTTEMDEWMAASDLIVGKPGGLTTSEALASGVIFVVVDPIPGQEERNSDHLLEEGAAIRCNNLPVLAYKIDQLLDDPARMAAMRHNALRLARPRAAQDIVRKLWEIHHAGQDRPAASPAATR